LARATAIVLAREGARVIVVDRRLDSAQETVNMILAEGGQAWPFETDVTDEDAVRRLVATSVQRLGRLDILHNNVGASLALGDAPATELTGEAFQRSFDVNLKATWLACKRALPGLRETQGSIVNIASMAARNAYPLVGYKTTKAAVVALTENLAAANARHGVRATGSSSQCRSSGASLRAIVTASARVHGQFASTMIGTPAPATSRAAAISGTVISCSFTWR
jgi:NAD(P)-dependent dehydrogenase (short-subunit alcohol dehydrogenase family)